jgi:aminoglycoside phosphotransferase (APT) family kinase protein
MRRRSEVDPVALERCVRRALPNCTSLQIDRTEEGVSTLVYHVRCSDAAYYLRVAYTADESFEPEARAHELLRERGVRVPEVVYLDGRDADLERPVMMTTEIKGRDVRYGVKDQKLSAVIRDAGRQLAIVNSISVEGFGWIRRGGSQQAQLTAPHPTYGSFVLEHLERDLQQLAALGLLTAPEIASVREALEAWRSDLDVDQAHLAHGDFDVTAVFAEERRFSGIIDLGEMRGAHELYDLGHFCVHDREHVPTPLLPFLVEGYADVRPLPTRALASIHLHGLLIALRALARSVDRSPSPYPKHLLTATRGCLSALSD